MLRGSLEKCRSCVYFAQWCTFQISRKDFWPRILVSSCIYYVHCIIQGLIFSENQTTDSCRGCHKLAGAKPTLVLVDSQMRLQVDFSIITAGSYSQWQIWGLAISCQLSKLAHSILPLRGGTLYTQQDYMAVMWYPISQLLHWYLYWSNRAALVK